MGIGSPSIPMNSALSTVNIEGEGFGSVFQSLMSATAIPAKSQTLGADQELTKLLGEVLNADSLEVLEGLLEDLKQSVKSPIVAQLLKEAGLRQTISVIGTAVEKNSTVIIEKTTELLVEESKLEPQLDAIPNSKLEPELDSKLQQTQALFTKQQQVQKVASKLSEDVGELLSQMNLELTSTESSERNKIEAIIQDLMGRINKGLLVNYPLDKTLSSDVIKNLVTHHLTELNKNKSLVNISLNNANEIITNEFRNNDFVKTFPEDIPDVELTLTDLPNLYKFPSLQQLAALISKSPDKLIEEVAKVLEDVDVTKKQLDEIAATGDIWFVLDVLQQLPPEKIKIVIEQLPSKVAVELTALLKTIELTAPKMDLFTKQMDLVKTIQPILSQFASQLEAKVVQPEAKQPVQIPSAMQHVIRFTTEQSAAAALISKNPDKLIEAVTKVLEGVGVTKTQLDEIAATGNIWFVLDVLQQLPPEKIKKVIEQLPSKAAVELTALLKIIELTAPKMDLFTKQIDLVKTIQPILSQFASQLEAKVVQPEAKQPVQIPSAMQHVIRFTTEQSAADAKQQDQQSKANETVTPVTATTQNEARPVFQMNTTEKVPESRSEALMREFQAVLNRANFGQTNGMNRISIKLYPEHLGQIRIELLEVNGVMTARILASTAMAREMLDSQMHQLRHAFNQQNLQVDRIDLSQTLQDPSKSDREQAFNKQNQQQKEQATDQNETQDEQQQTFQEFMIELEA